jgi:hypothetical protein
VLVDVVVVVVLVDVLVVVVLVDVVLVVVLVDVVVVVVLIVAVERVLVYCFFLCCLMLRVVRIIFKPPVTGVRVPPPAPFWCCPLLNSPIVLTVCSLALGGRTHALPLRVHASTRHWVQTRSDMLTDRRNTRKSREEILDHRQYTVPLCLGVRGPGIAELRSVACRVAS